MSAVLTIAGVDVSAETLYEVNVACGREDHLSQPDGSVLDAQLKGWIGAGKVGDTVSLALNDGRILFHGRITDLGSSMDDAGEWLTKITATGPLAALGSATAGLGNYPEEMDGQRIARILDEAGFAHGINAAIVGPAVVARAAETGNAADMARRAADSGMGVLWEQPQNVEAPIRYTPQRLRKWGAYEPSWAELSADQSWAELPAEMTWGTFDADNVPVSDPIPYLLLDPAAVFAEIDFSQTIGDWARSHTVTYGPKEPTPRPAVSTGTGNPHASWDTDLASQAEAEQWVTTRLRQTIEPSWRLSRLEVRLNRVADAQALLDALSVGARVDISFPLGSPVGIQWQGFLEGWKHHLIPDDHRLALQVSDRALTEAADRWIDIPSAETWDSTSAEMRWIDAVDWS